MCDKDSAGNHWSCPNIPLSTFFHQHHSPPPSRPRHHGRRPQSAFPARPRRCSQRPHPRPQCPVCQSTFTRPQHVARHMRSREWLLPSPAPTLRWGAPHRSPIPTTASLTASLLLDTGDRPYKCQHCGDQFARRHVSISHIAHSTASGTHLHCSHFSDLLSRHINKCHASEKPPTTTAPSRRKGFAAASRATTSKQACDQCVTSSLPCDGANPCCTYCLSSVSSSFLTRPRTCSKMRPTEMSMHLRQVPPPNRSCWSWPSSSAHPPPGRHWPPFYLARRTATA